MREYQRQAISGAVVGALGVVIVGEAWHVQVETDRPEPGAPRVVLALPLASPPSAGPDDAPHRESAGAIMFRYSVMTATSSSGALLAVTVGEARDLRDLCVPVTFTGSRYAFGQEYWRSA